MKKRYDKQKLKSFPNLKSDKAAEDFVRDADLSEYDLRGFRPMKFEFAIKGKSFMVAHKTARINMRLPEELLERIKKIADKKDIPYTRLIRQLLEAIVEREQQVRSR